MLFKNPHERKSGDLSSDDLVAIILLSAVRNIMANFPMSVSTMGCDYYVCTMGSIHTIHSGDMSETSDIRRKKNS